MLDARGMVEISRTVPSVDDVGCARGVCEVVLVESEEEENGMRSQEK